MRYFGGKSRIGREIADHINRVPSLHTYWEPFCGGCSVIEHVRAPERVASDLHESLILLWKALQEGWEPPDTVTEEQYDYAKLMETSALKAFIGFGCSNSGKWFGGYARENTARNFAMNAKRSLARKLKSLGDVEFYRDSYNEVGFPEGWVIYCDPPYGNTTGFSTGKFDHEKFWDWARKASENNVVLVSEYEAPEDFAVVWEKEVKTDMNKADGKTKHRRVERLFKLIPF